MARQALNPGDGEGFLCSRLTSGIQRTAGEGGKREKGEISWQKVGAKKICHSADRLLQPPETKSINRLRKKKGKKGYLFVRAFPEGRSFKAWLEDQVPGGGEKRGRGGKMRALQVI